MKFQRYLVEQQEEEWKDFYIEYKRMKKIIKRIAISSDEAVATVALDGKTQGVVSLSVPSLVSFEKDDSSSESYTVEEDFFQFLELEMKKVHRFTYEKVANIRSRLIVLNSELEEAKNFFGDEFKQRMLELKDEAIDIGNTFLKLEKYVNLNFTGFYKILKKHDKCLPMYPPCKAFYMARLHNQSWVRGDFSDVLVTLSRMHGELRGDKDMIKPVILKQAFVRSTRKYWVRVEDVSEVKCRVLQYLPVFLQKTMGGETDSQLINSVYLDNTQMELYRGRLDKTPGAIALRFRWYGYGGPKQVFVERKTHEESWTGLKSVKERFIVREDQVLSLLQGQYDIEAEEENMRNSGKSDEQISNWKELVISTLSAITSKQLTPMLRTQYMRTAFQVPHDSTVRISCTRWYRDPSIPYTTGSITRFPHAVLEIKLEVEDETLTPDWIKDLLSSGLIHEAHKFSKFVHGCAVIHHDDVQSVPYWIDDVTLWQSIVESGAQSLLSNTSGANVEYSHLMPLTKVDFTQRNVESDGAKNQKMLDKVLSEVQSLQKMKVSMRNERIYQSNSDRRYTYVEVTEPDNCCSTTFCGEFTSSPEDMRIIGQKVEPKIFFANERTFIHWLHMAVRLSSVSIAVLAFGSPNDLGQYYALTMLFVSLLFCIYALTTFTWRSARIHDRVNERWDEPKGPMLLGISLAAALLFNFGLKFNHFMVYHWDNLTP